MAAPFTLGPARLRPLLPHPYGAGEAVLNGGAWLVLPPTRRAERENARFAFQVFAPQSRDPQHLVGLYNEPPWAGESPYLTQLKAFTEPMPAQIYFIKLLKLGLPSGPTR